MTDPWRMTSISEFAPHKNPYFPRITKDIIEKAEIRLGFRFPELLRQMYLQVGNGGFGPGYGILGLEDGYRDRDDIAIHDGSGVDLVQLYFSFRGAGGSLSELEHNFDLGTNLYVEAETFVWFDKLLPICNWGCWQISCVDCAKTDFPVLLFVGYEYTFQLQNRSFNEWIKDWLNDDLHLDG